MLSLEFSADPEGCTRVTLYSLQTNLTKEAHTLQWAGVSLRRILIVSARRGRREE